MAGIFFVYVCVNMKHTITLLLSVMLFSTSFGYTPILKKHYINNFQTEKHHSLAFRVYAFDTSMTIPQMQYRIRALQGPKIAGFAIGGLGFACAVGGLACAIIGPLMHGNRAFTVAGIGWITLGAGCVLMVPGGLMSGISYYKQDRYRSRIRELEQRGF